MKQEKRVQDIVLRKWDSEKDGPLEENVNQPVFVIVTCKGWENLLLIQRLT